MRKYIDSRYQDEEYVNFISETIKTNNWWKNNVANPVSEMLDEQYPKEYKKLIEPAFNSIGRLIPSVALSFVSPKVGAKSAATTLAALSKAYFVANTYGASYTEAVNSGANLNDAHIYALGNAGLELGTEMIGGWIPGEFNATSMANILKNIGTETFEEMLAEVAGSGYDYWLSPDREVDNINPVELRERVLYSALVGGLSGGIFGGIGKIQAASMIETDVDAINTELRKAVETGDGKGKQVDQKKLSQSTEQLIKKLNSEKTPQWRKEQILQNPLIKPLVNKQGGVLDTTYTLS